MNREKLLRFSFRLATSLISTRKPWLSVPSLTQVTRYFQLTQFPPFSTFKIPQISSNNFNLHQNLFFSSKPESFIDFVLSNDWSEEIEIELDNMNPNLTHESIIYVLLKLNQNPQKCSDFFKWVFVKKRFDPSYVPYTILLKCLACREFMEDFWDVVDVMEEKGFFIDKHVYLHVNTNLTRKNMDKEASEWTKFYNKYSKHYTRYDVTKDVVDLILESDWNEEVKGELKKKLSFELTENSVLTALREIWKQPSKALEFFERVGASFDGYEHNSVTYNAMLKILARSESINEFWKLVGRMQNKGFEVDLDTYMKIVRLDRLSIIDAVKLFELMMDGPYKPSLPECVALLKGISHDSNPDMDLVYKVVNKYVAAGNTLSKRVYEGIHRVLCKIGNLDEAKKIVQEMRDAGYEPDNIIYSQEVYGLGKQNRFEEACNLLLYKMEEEGCVPDIKTWTILLQEYCATKQVDQALSLFYKMLEKNVNPDAEMLDVLINGFISKNKLFAAYRFLIEMVKKGRVKPWRATYKFMIEKLSEAVKFDEALKLLSMMEKQGYTPFPDPIIQYVSKSGTVEHAKKVLWTLSDDNGPPTSGTYVLVVRSFLEEGREAEARHLVYSGPIRVRRNKTIRNLWDSSMKKTTV